VPLVREKPTVVLVYVQSDGVKFRNVTAELDGFNDKGNPLPGSPLAPMPAYATVTASKRAPDRSELDESIIFELPWDWTTFSTTLTAEINPTFIDMETNASNNNITAVPEFYTLPRICIRTIPVRAKRGPSGVDAPLLPWNYLRNDPDGMIPRALSQLPTRDIWIFPFNDVIEKPTPFMFNQGAEGYMLNRWGVPTKLLGLLWNMDQLSNDPNICDRMDARTHYMGMIHERAAWNKGGFADGFIANDQLLVKFDTAGDWPDDPWGGDTLAHELGHNYGRWHVNCGGVSKGEPKDKQFPYNKCMFAPNTSPDTYYGTDLADLTDLDVIPPVEPSFFITLTLDYARGDLMSYANDTWISDWNWRRIGLKLCRQGFRNADCIDWEYPTALAANVASTDTPSLSLLPASPLTVTYPYSGDILLISGQISLTAQISGTASLSDTYRLESVMRLPQGLMPQEKLDDLWQQQSELTAGGSDYELRLLDGSEVVLYTQPFSASAVFDGSGAAFFGLAAPYITDTERIEIAFQTSPVLSQTASANPPTVTVLTPIGGETISETLTIFASPGRCCKYLFTRRR